MAADARNLACAWSYQSHREQVGSYPRLAPGKELPWVLCRRGECAQRHSNPCTRLVHAPPSPYRIPNREPEYRFSLPRGTRGEPEHLLSMKSDPVPTACELHWEA